MSRVTYWFVLAWTVGVTGFLLFGPVYAGRSTAMGADGSIVESSRDATLLAVNGPHVLPVLAIPLVLVVAPALVRKPRRRAAGLACGILLLGLAFIGGFSIGMLYYPSALGLLISAASVRPIKQG